MEHTKLLKCKLKLHPPEDGAFFFHKYALPKMKGNNRLGKSNFFEMKEIDGNEYFREDLKGGGRIFKIRW
jgi:hypothetical protein